MSKKTGFAVDPNNLMDMSCKHDGRVVKVEMYINTDEDLNALLARLSTAARGPSQAAVFSGYTVLTDADGRAAWKLIQDASSAIAADPRTKAVGADGKPL